MSSFRSKAAYYSRYRVPYPERLIAQLKVDANLGCDSRVLDLATGPGRMALALAPSVHEVVAVDVEPNMLEEGTRVARRQGIDNVEWIHARAEDLSVAPGSMDLVTIGEAFHRLDQDLMLQRIRQWLRDGACVALGGCFGILHGRSPWQESLRHALSKWEKGRSDDAGAKPRGQAHDTRRLAEAGFTGVVNREFTDSHTWTHESILGHLHSTARFSPSALGEELEEFENAVLGALGPEEPSAGEASPTAAAYGSAGTSPVAGGVLPRKFTRFRQEISCGYSIGWTRCAQSKPG